MIPNNTKTPKLDSIEAVLLQLQNIATSRQENFVLLTLDQNKRLINNRVVFIGTLTSVIVHPREVFAYALEDRAASIIIAHNHPSGDPSPTEQDIAITQQFVAAGRVLGIHLENHVIVTNSRSYSFFENQY